MKSLALFLFLFSTIAEAVCLQTSAENMTISFEAYKTPLKIGVGAKLPAISFKEKAQGKNWMEATISKSIIIDASKIDSGDKARDKKIAKFFFKNAKINAVVTKIDEKKKQLTMTIVMNEKTRKNVLMNYTYTNNTLKAHGYVDAFDFGMSENIKALNKACFAKHSGKTWSDVKIALEANFKRCK